MPKLVNGKILSKEESEQLLSLAISCNISQSAIGKLMSKPRSGAMIGSLLRGQSAGSEQDFLEIRKILAKAEKAHDKYKKALA